MSKRSRRRARAQRDRFLSIAPERAVRNPILMLEDRRRFEPVDDYPRALFHRSARLVVSPNVNKSKSRAAGRSILSSGLPAHIKFNVPREVALCVRRKQRREVLFAKRRTGKGARAVRRRRNFWSNVRC